MAEQQLCVQGKHISAGHSLQARRRCSLTINDSPV